MVLLTVIFLALLLLFVHPYVTYPLSLLALTAFYRKRLNPTGAAPRSYAIVCCAYNERAVIEAKITNLLEVSRRLGNCKIYVHSDGSTDGTAEVLRAHGDEVTVSIAEQRGGKSAGMNRLLSMTDAEVVIFTDANVMIDVDQITGLGHYFQDPEVGCATGHLVYLVDGASETATVGRLYRGFEEFLKRLETDTGTVIYTDGTLFALRRKLFAPVPLDITDDFHSALSVLCQGYRNVSAPDLIAYERAASVQRDELRRRIRIGCRVFNCHRLFWPRLRKLDYLTLYKYLSHKLIRWLSGYILLATLFVGLLLSFVSYGLWGAALYLGLIALVSLLGARTKLRVFRMGWEGLLATMATAYGVLLSLRGERFQTWTVAASSRK